MKRGGELAATPCPRCGWRFTAYVGKTLDPVRHRIYLFWVCTYCGSSGEASPLLSDYGGELNEHVSLMLARPPVPCSLCKDPVHRVADIQANEFSWAGEDGHRSAMDGDLRHLTPDPYAYLTWLGQEMDRLGRQQRTVKKEKVWPDAQTEAEYFARGREYGSLKVRLDMKGYLHQHVVFPAADLPWFTGTAPQHCGWPMRLAPSGWVCRQCPHREG